MFRFALRFTNPIKTTTISTISHLHFLYKYSSISQIPHEKEEEVEEPIQKNNHASSLTVTYLMNSCGLSPQSALSASKKITIKSTKKPDSIVSVFKSYGFTNTHVTKIISKMPKLLSSKPDKTIIPKLEFFLSVGILGTQPTKIISLYPDLLKISLEKRLKPNFRLLSSVFETDQQISIALRRHPSWLLRPNLETYFLPNVRTLQGYGVPTCNIAKLASLNPRVLMKTTKQFTMTIKSIREMGFNPLSTMFIKGTYVMLGLSRSSLERKVALYKSLGWSEEEIISAFTKYPYFMLSSEEKIRRSLDFFVSKMHRIPSFLAANPVFLTLSLEKRVIPWCSVLNLLASKGLVKKSFVKFLKISENDFLNKYVIKYQDQVPEVLRAYSGDLDFVGLQEETAIIQCP